MTAFSADVSTADSTRGQPKLNLQIHSSFHVLVMILYFRDNVQSDVDLFLSIYLVIHNLFMFIFTIHHLKSDFYYTVYDKKCYNGTQKFAKKLIVSKHIK